MFVILGRGRRVTGPRVVLLGLVCAGLYLWNHRPLSEAERRIVGTWALNSESGTQLRFAEDRRMSFKSGAGTTGSGAKGADAAGFVYVGRWSASEDALQVVVPGIWRRSWWSPSWTSSAHKDGTDLSRGGWNSRRNLRFLRIVGPDHLTLDMQLYFRVRTDPEPAASPPADAAVAGSRS